jgi:hypothetical protein
VGDIEAAIAALAEGVNGAAQFSGSAVERFDDVRAAFKTLGAELDTMRENTRSEFAALRDRVSGKETTAARERAERAEAVNDARHEASQRSAERQHIKTRTELADLREGVRNVTQLIVKDKQWHGG